MQCPSHLVLRQATIVCEADARATSVRGCLRDDAHVSEDTGDYAGGHQGGVGRPSANGGRFAPETNVRAVHTGTGSAIPCVVAT
jgi:hypothetical protein